MIKKIDITDLLLDPPEKKGLSPKTIHFFIFIIAILLIYFIYGLFQTQVKEILEEKKEILITKEIMVKKEAVVKKEGVVKKDKKIINIASPILLTKNIRFIQVSTFPNNKNDKNLIRKIEKNNFNYKILKGDTYTRILLGPYKNYDEAKSAISEIKEKIRKDSFITSKIY